MVTDLNCAGRDFDYGVGAFDFVARAFDCEFVEGGNVFLLKRGALFLKEGRSCC